MSYRAPIADILFAMVHEAGAILDVKTGSTRIWAMVLPRRLWRKRGNSPKMFSRR